MVNWGNKWLFRFKCEFPEYTYDEAAIILERTTWGAVVSLRYAFQDVGFAVIQELKKLRTKLWNTKAQKSVRRGSK